MTDEIRHAKRSNPRGRNFYREQLQWSFNFDGLASHLRESWNTPSHLMQWKPGYAPVIHRLKERGKEKSQRLIYYLTETEMVYFSQLRHLQAEFSLSCLKTREKRKKNIAMCLISQ